MQGPENSGNILKYWKGSLHSCIILEFKFSCYKERNKAANPTIKFWAFNLHYTEGKASRKGELTQLITGKMNSISSTGLPLHSILQVISVAENKRKDGWLRKGTSYLAFEELHVYSGSATQCMSEKMCFSLFYPSELHIFLKSGDVCSFMLT